MEYLPYQHLVWWCLGTTVVVTFIAILRRIYFHELSRYPGPWLGKFSELLTIVAVAQRRRTFQEHEFLLKYGSPLRMGTNHLLFSDMSSIADIYGQSSNPCLKDETVYGGLTATGATNVLNVIDRDQHARLRRLISHSFSLESLLEAESFIQGKIDQYLSMFRGTNQPIDILERTYQLMLDIVSQLSFGESYDCLGGRNPTAQHDVQAFFTVVPPLSFAPVLRFLPIKSIQEGRKGLARLHEFSRAHVAAYVSKSADVLDHGPKGKFLQKMATAIDADTGTRLTKEELVENAIIFLTAGSGTTAATVIYLMWECGRQPDIKRRLIDEIRGRFPDPNTVPSYKEASKLIFLNCVIEETLRLRGPLSGGATRVSPGKIIAGRYVPKGVIVETNIYSTSRDPQVFPNPEQFNPARWGNATEEMRTMARPFGYGPRNCVGRHLAQINLVLTIARLYQLYDILPDPSLSSEKMKQVDLGVMEPGCHDFFVTAVEGGK